MNLLHIHGKCCAYKITPGWLSKKLSWLEYDLLLAGRPSDELTQERALQQAWLLLRLLGLPAGRPAMHMQASRFVSSIDRRLPRISLDNPSPPDTRCYFSPNFPSSVRKKF
jgi:hypothetical protein